MILSALTALTAGSLSLSAAPQEPAAAAAAAPQIAWQRSLADALAVQKQEGVPLLLVVNMDGEVFNDRFASETYHRADFVELTRGYACVVASPDRHAERDYDAQGNRIECPRFGGCTCSEHIAVEPELFARYFNGQRAAPRHVGVGKDGKILFDRYLDASMQTAIDAITTHRGSPRKTRLPTDAKGLLQQRAAAARVQLEQRYRQGDRAARLALLEAAQQATSEPFDLLRLALRADDDALFAAGARALAKTATAAALIDVEDALARVDDEAVAGVLVARLQALGKDDKAAARLAAHFARTDAAAVLGGWAGEWRAAEFDPLDRATIETALDRCEA